MKAKAERLLVYLLPGLGSILWVAIFMGVAGLGPRMMNIDGDLGRHLTIGAYILDSGRVPSADLFSHTLPGAPLIPHEWLSQVIFALANRWLGLGGVILVCGLVIASSFWLVFRSARAGRQGVLMAAAVTLAAVAASSLHWLARPHVFTFLMLALWMSVLEEMRRGRPQRWLFLPLIMLLWVNLHGAFIAGFVTWAVYGFGLWWDAFWHRGRGLGGRSFSWRSFWLGGAASLIATLANPSGLKVWGLSVGYVGSRYLVGHTAEYLPPNFHDPSTWPFLFLIGLFLVGLGLQNERQEAAQLFPAAAWLIMALYSVRNVPLFVITAAPLLAGVLDEWLAASRRRLKALERFTQLDRRISSVDSQLREGLLPAAAVVFVIMAFRAGVPLDFQRTGNVFDPQVFPVRAADWLVEHPQSGRPFNYFPWGGYLLYRHWPDVKVFIDGQTDFYGEALTRQYEQVVTLSPGWEDVLDQYSVDWVIFPVGEPLAVELSSRPGWAVLYQDSTAVILGRASP